MRLSWWQRAPKGTARPAAKSCRPRLEALEDRLTPSTFAVENLNDSGTGSLRQAILGANADTATSSLIAFDTSVTGTINLLTALPDLSHNVTVAGPGAKLLTVQRSAAPGTPDFRIFTVDDQVTAILSGLTVKNGKATAGGGILNQGSLLVADSVITGNTATDIGGGISNGTFETTGNPQLSVLDSTVSNNTASNGRGAGGIDSEAGTLVILGCTVSGNQAPGSHAAGGVGAYGGTAGILNSTVANNSADAGDAGGVEGSAAANVLYDTIVAANTAGGVSADVLGTFTSRGHNLIGNGTGATGLTNGSNGDQVGSAASVLNADLGPLQDNGGATPTMALLPGSPAIDHGDNTSAPPADQRGFVRVFNTTIDIGAFEVQSPTLVATLTTATLVTASPTAGLPLTFGISVSEVVTDASATLPAGPVHVSVDGGAATDVTLQSDGTATFNLPAGLAQGNHSLAVTYDTNSTFAGSNGSATFTVNAAPAPTSTSLSASAAAVAFGQPVTLTAKVTSGAGTPSGSVTFLDGGAPLGAAAVDGSGVATLTVTLGPGAHSLTAVYAGGSTFAGSSSPAVGVSVAPPPLTGDVTAVVSVSQTPGPGRKTVKTVTLTLVNGSGQEIQGPLVVVLNGLKPTVRVSGASGFTGSKKHRVPFVVLNPAGGLFPPGGQLSVALKFRGQGVHFTTTVKAGSSAP
jgi:hypothetical protein